MTIAERREAREAIADAERHTQGLRDKYNTIREQPDINDYKTIINANIDYAPMKHENYLDYLQRLKIYAKISNEKNFMTHVTPPKGKQWYTHRSPSCFMCEDQNLISALVRVIGYLATKYPKDTF